MKKHTLSNILGSLAIASVAYIGCNSNSPNQQPIPQSKNYFDSFGEFNALSHGRYGYTNSVVVGDMDGDGDLDIIISESAGDTIIIYENRIPQSGNDSNP